MFLYQFNDARTRIMTSIIKNYLLKNEVHKIESNFNVPILRHTENIKIEKQRYLFSYQ